MFNATMEGRVPSEIQLAIAGLGLVGLRHAAAIEQVGGVRLAAVIEPDEQGKQAATKLGINCYDELDACLTTEDVQGVILATPTSLHVEQASVCIKHGLPTLIEKPIAMRSVAAQSIVQQSMQMGVPILVGHHRRHNPLIRKAREIIESGQIGKIRAVHATCWFYKPDAYFQNAPWRMQSGAGPVSVNLVHDIDLIRYLCGSIISVQAITTPSVRGFENEDLASAVLGFDNGIVGTVSVSDSIAAPWSWELTSREYPVYPSTSESCYLIGGSTGSVSIPDLRVWTHEEGKPDWWTPISAKSFTRDTSDPLINQIRHFCDIIRGVASPLVCAAEGLRTLQVVEAIQQAASTGTKVIIQPFELSGVEEK